MQVLYPDIKPYAEHQLTVEAPHELYIEESGNPDGIPVVFLHGGPGGGCSPRDRRFFDPEVYRIVLYDQRGAGRSTPFAELEGNHTAALIDDLERIREFLQIDRWVVFGGSWGSTLGLLYGQAYPERCLGMILRGICLFRQQEFDWMYKDGANRVFPDAWAAFEGHIPESERDDLPAAYFRRLTGDNELARMSAAKVWSHWEAQLATLQPSHKVEDSFAEPHTAVPLAVLEAHYTLNRGFIEEGQILAAMESIAAIPAILVHGRYDMICPLENAYSLHRAWPGSQLQIIREAGHSTSEAAIVDALVQAGRDMARELKKESD